MGSGTQHSRLQEKLACELGARANVAGAAARAAELLRSLRALQFCIFEPMSAEDAVVGMTRGPLDELVKLLNVSMRLLRSLPAFVSAHVHSGEPDDLLAEVEHALVPAFVEGTPTPPLDKFCEQLDALVATLPALPSREAFVQQFLSVCGRTVQALKEAREAIRQQRRQQSKWGLITAGEEARRKAQKSLRAATMLAMFLVHPEQAENLFPDELSELQTALCVRRALMTFRRDTLIATGQCLTATVTELAATLQQLKARITALSAEPAYSNIRLPDRFALQMLLAQMTQALRAPQLEYAPAKALVVAMRRAAAGLKGVNRREILVRHDAAIVAHTLQILPPPFDAKAVGNLGPQIAQALQNVARVRWRSEALDQWMRFEGQPEGEQTLHHAGRIQALVEILAQLCLGEQVDGVSDPSHEGR